MSGKAIRRRAKLVQAANQGNLAKAQRGRASANLPLPNAPTKDDYAEKVPASLRRLMALRAAAEQPNAKRQKTGNQQSKQQQHHQHQHQQQSSQSAVQEQQADDQLHPKQLQLPMRPDKAAGAQAAAAAADVPHKVHAGVIWEQPKKLKQSRKEYLKKKKLKKKGKRIAAADDKELPVDRPAFGEVVHQPPTVQLKRKHWDAAAALKAQHQQQQQQRRKHKHKQQQAKPVKKQQLDPLLLELREQVIEGYRAGKGPREGLATLDSLKQLVK